MFSGKKILVGITGSIAAYKSAVLVRLLVKAGAEVKVIMTKAACDFIAPLTLATLSKHEVLTELFEEDTWSNHVMLGRWADIMLIAPASCNTIAAFAAGSCENILQAVYLSATCPVILAPAMDEDMWKHPATNANLAKLQAYGNHVLPVDNGELASGLTGEGRMAEPEAIVEMLADFFGRQQDLAKKKVLVTAGPTHEGLDPVRFIGNRSSGKMGIALAKECKMRGADVTLVIGPTAEILPEGMTIIKVETAAEMLTACVANFADANIAVMCAAVADYAPAETAKEKIKKTGDTLHIELHRTVDILKTLGSKKTAEQFLVGFALETENEEAHAVAKLTAKNADLIVLNSLKDEGAGFGYNTNKIAIFDRQGNRFPFDTKDKRKVAADIIDTVLKTTHA